ncbi:MAG: histone deacetylase [Anaerolineales bacterium]|nr:histone deacetylase [Anaerolineales bacterium]MDW8446999.1 histone deacetylase [Anaerolineales bacterium]
MEEIVYYYPQGHEKHFQSGHPERPERVETIVKALREKGLWDGYPKVEPRPLSPEEISGVHSISYLKELEGACRYGESLDMDTYTTPYSWELATRTAGGAVSVAEAVWKREAKRGFALTRPPGHHATSKRGMGFCLLNNVAAAAQWLVQHLGVQRIAILDFDLHHGNGTQEIFWTRSDVFFLSTHQSPLYPGSGYLDEIGYGEGRGYTANFPLPPGSGDQAFSSLLQEVIIPLLDRYQPQMLLLSYGFDPHWRDPLGHLQLSAKQYGEMIRLLSRWCDAHCEGRIALFLEGGYDLEAAKACTLAVVNALLGQPFEDPLGPSPREEGRSWVRVLEQAKQLWQL